MSKNRLIKRVKPCANSCMVLLPAKWLGKLVEIKIIKEKKE